MKTWSTKNYFLILTDQDTTSVEISIFKKYYIDEHYQSHRLIKKINIKGDKVGIGLLLMSYEDYEVEKLLKNTENTGVN
jgi:hypothetical protein